jgi:hypothetical protein
LDCHGFSTEGVERNANHPSPSVRFPSNGLIYLQARISFLTSSYLKNIPDRHCELPGFGSEAISQAISFENSVRDCFVGKITLLAMTENEGAPHGRAEKRNSQEIDGLYAGLRSTPEEHPGVSR